MTDSRTPTAKVGISTADRRPSPNLSRIPNRLQCRSIDRSIKPILNHQSRTPPPPPTASDAPPKDTTAEAVGSLPSGKTYQVVNYTAWLDGLPYFHTLKCYQAEVNAEKRVGLPPRTALGIRNLHFIRILGEPRGARKSHFKGKFGELLYKGIHDTLYG